MDLSGRIINNRYRLLEMVDSDGVSDLYHASDSSKKDRHYTIAIFRNSAVSDRIEDMIRFRKDIGKVSELRHHNIAGILDTGIVFESNYIIYEYLAGARLSEYIDNEKNFSPDQAVDIVTQICRALVCLHGQGIIIQHLNPLNVFMAGNLVKIINIGLAHIYDFGETASDDIVSIIKYVSPEQSGILRRAVDERSDLFSLGVLFYRLLAGVLPFDGDDICSILHQQIAKIPDNPKKYNGEIPEILWRVAARLLEKDPQNRYQSAGGLLFDLEQFSHGEKAFTPGVNDRSSVVNYWAQFTGRDRELARLRELFNAAQAGVGSICLILGEAGTGKSRLVEEFKNIVYAENCSLLYSKCFEGLTAVPYRPVATVLNAYIKNYYTYPEERKRQISGQLKDEFSELGEIIIRLSPRMKELLGKVEPLVPLDQDSENRRFHNVCSRFIKRLSDLEKGLVVVLEDLQWSDVGTLHILEALKEDISRHPVMVIITCRTDDGTGGSSSKALLKMMGERNLQVEMIYLDTFDSSRTRELTSRILLESSEGVGEISDFLYQKGKGNVLFTISLLRQLIEEDILIRNEDRWHFDEKRLKNVEVSQSIVEVILSRIRFLDDKEKSILSSAAVIGKEFELPLLFTVSSLEKWEIVEIIDRAVGLQILEQLPDPGNSYIFSHDRIKEAFYAINDEDSRKNLHSAVAEALERTNVNDNGDIYFDLAHHYLEGGNNDKFLKYALPAGIKALGNYAYEDAERFFLKALLIMGQEDHSEQWMECKEKLGNIYLITGRFSEAIEIFTDILPLIKARLQKSGILAQLSDAYYRVSNWALSISSAQEGLRLLGERFPSGPLLFTVSTLKELLIQIAHAVVPIRYARVRKSHANERYRLIVGLYRSLIHTYVFSNSGREFVWSSIRMANVSQSRIGLSKELSMSLISLGLFGLAFPCFSMSQRFFYRALEISNRIGDKWNTGYAYGLLALMHEFMARYRKGIGYFYRRSFEAFSEVGDIKNIGVVYCGRAQSYYFLSEYRHALDNNDKSYAIARSIGDKIFEGMALVYYARIYREKGDLEKAHEYCIKSLEFNSENDFRQSYCATLIERGCLYLESGQPEKAIKHLEEARELFEASNFSKQHTIHLYSHLAEAYLSDFIRVDMDLSPSERKVYARRVKRSCSSAVRKTRRWRSYLGRAYRITGSFYAQVGCKRKAEKFFLKSINICEEIGFKFDLACAHYEYGLFLVQVNRKEESAVSLESAFGIFNEIGAGSYMRSLGAVMGVRALDDSTSMERLIDRERHDFLERLRRKIFEFTDTDELLDEIIFRFMEYAGARRGYIFLKNGSSGELNLAASRALDESAPVMNVTAIARRVVQSGEIEVADNREEEEFVTEYGSESVMGGETVISIPIRFQTDVLGVCCLEKPYGTGFLAEGETGLLQDLLSQVALSLVKYVHERKPPRKEGQSLTLGAEEKLQRAIAYIDENFTSDISREGLAAYLDLSPNYLGKLFRDYTGQKINDYINELRVKNAMRQLKDTDQRVIDIAFSVGFENLRTFNRAFQKVGQISPQKFRELSKK